MRTNGDRGLPDPLLGRDQAPVTLAYELDHLGLTTPPLEAGEIGHEDIRPSASLAKERKMRAMDEETTRARVELQTGDTRERGGLVTREQVPAITVRLEDGRHIAENRAIWLQDQAPKSSRQRAFASASRSR